MPRPLLVAALLLAVPTALMGATFPLVVRWIAGSGERHVARMYTVNTAGGAVGAAASAFVLIPRLGMTGALATAAAANAAAAALALAATRRQDGRLARPDEPPPAESPPATRLAPLLFGTRLLALALEVVWTRALDQVLAGTVYSFATVLGVFLAGIAGGALACGAVLRRFGAVRALVALELFLAGYVLASSWLLPAVPAVAAALARVLALGLWWRGLVLEAVVSASVLAAPAFAMGLAFPLLLSLRAPRARLGGLVAANTAGCVLGPLAAALVLLPLLGLEGALAAAAVLAAALAAALAFHVDGPQRSWALAASASVAVAALILRAPPAALVADRGDRILEQVEDPGGTVAVVRDGSGQRRLKVNRAFSQGGGQGVFTERRQGHLPMLLHARPERVMVVGVGTANTLAAVRAHGPRELVAVELVDGVLRLAARHFADTNEGVLRDPLVRILRADGRHVARRPPGPFDLIVADLFHPWQAGVGALYSAEHFANVRRALAPGGVFCQWLPLYQLAPEDLRVIVRTFLSVFPEASAWLGNFGSTTPVLALAGSEEPVGLRWERWSAAMADPQLAARLAGVYLDRPAEVYGSFVADRAGLRRFAGAGALNTLRRPLIEFSAPRALLAERLEAGKLESLRAVLALAPEAAVPFAGAAPVPPAAEVAANRRAIRWMMEAFVARETGNPVTALERSAEAAAAARGYDVPGLALVSLAFEAQEAVPRESLRALQVAVAHRPGDASALAGLGNALLEAGRGQEAEVVFEKALAASPGWPEALQGLERARAAAAGGWNRRVR